jgi:hypothetical protein
VSEACLLLSEQAYLVELDLSLFLPEVRTKERSCGAGLHIVKEKREVVVDPSP